MNALIGVATGMVDELDQVSTGCPRSDAGPDAPVPR